MSARKKVKDTNKRSAAPKLGKLDIKANIESLIAYQAGRKNKVTKNYKQFYRKAWESCPEFKEWLTEFPSDRSLAFCKICQKTLHAHRLSLTKHTVSLRHSRLAQKKANQLQYEEEDDYDEEEYDDGEDGAGDGRHCEDEDDEEYSGDGGGEEEGDGGRRKSSIVLVKDDGGPGRGGGGGRDLRGEEGGGSEQRSINVSVVVTQGRKGEEERIRIIQDDEEEEEEEGEEMTVDEVRETEEEEDSDEGELPEYLQSVLDDDEPQRSNTAKVYVRDFASLVVPDDSTRTAELQPKKPGTATEAEMVAMPCSIRMAPLSSLTTTASSSSPVKDATPSSLVSAVATSPAIKVKPPASSYYHASAGSPTSKHQHQQPAANDTIAHKPSYNKHTRNNRRRYADRPPITTHVLDTAKGLPAAGLAVSLYQLIAGRWTLIKDGCTNGDGRCSTLTSPGSIKPGRYKLHFDTDRYFILHRQPTFFPFIEVIFDVCSPDDRNHIPVLLSPFGYTTYKGS